MLLEEGNYDRRMKKSSVDQSNMRTYLSLPEAKPAPAIIVVVGQTGVADFVKFSDLAAQQGFVAGRRIFTTAIRRIAKTTRILRRPTGGSSTPN